MTEPPPVRERPSLPTVRTVLPIAALLLVLVVALLPSPYAIERPGPVFDTLGRTTVSGRSVPVVSIPDRTTYASSGSLDALTVSLVGTPSSGPSWLDLAAAWVDPAQAVVPLEDVYSPGVSEQQADQESAEEMTDSQQAAVAAALTELGDRVRSTVTVAAVLPHTAAAGHLRTGDAVVSYAGRPIAAGCSLQDAVQGGDARTAVVGIRRDGETRSLSLTPRLTDVGDGTKLPLLGIETDTAYTFPFTVKVQLGDVGGPSAGMMFALGIIDELTPGSLTGGAHVAGTGTICPDGDVGAIGGIRQKMAGARAAGATVFLAPAANCDEVVGHIPAGLQVFAVRRLSDSLAVLKTVAAKGSTAGLARCSAPVESRS